MSLKHTIEKEYKEAILSRNKDRKSILRLVLADIKNLEIDKGELSDDEVVRLLRTEEKKIRDSIAQFTKAERMDLAEKEEVDLAIVHELLPAQMGEEQIQTIINEVIESLDDSSRSNFGMVMGQVMSRVGSRADGSLVSKLVTSSLAK